MKLVHLTLSFAVACLYAATCRACPPELVRPCRCLGEEVQCVHLLDMETLSAVFDNSVDYPFRGFYLQASTVMYLKASWLSVKKMKRISIIDCTLNTLFDKDPAEDNEVELLQLDNVRMNRGIQWKELKPLKKITDLVVKNVDLRKIGEFLSDNVSPTLRVIRFESTKTKQLGDTAFHPFPDLQTIQVMDSKLSTLKRSMFPDSDNLLFIDFRNNRIESLPDDIFSGLGLTEILLSGNKLVTLPEAVFKNIFGQLFKLEVEDNPLMCNCSISWLVYAKELPSMLRGKCSAPANLKGRKLNDLREEEYRHCQH